MKHRRGADDRDAIAGWVRAAVGGDEDAFRLLYDRTANRVHRMARWLMGRDDVDDVVQDIYVRAWDRLPGLREAKSFEGWIHRLAVHVLLRSRGRLAGRPEVEWSPEAELASAQARPPGLQLDLERAVATLPAGARDVFLLYDMEGYTHKEIGAMLNISPHTSRSQLHRARALLRLQLSDRVGSVE